MPELGQGCWDSGARTGVLTFSAGAGTGMSDLGRVGEFGPLKCRCDDRKIRAGARTGLLGQRCWAGELTFSAAAATELGRARELGPGRRQTWRRHTSPEKEVTTTSALAPRQTQGWSWDRGAGTELLGQSCWDRGSHNQRGRFDRGVGFGQGWRIWTLSTPRRRQGVKKGSQPTGSRRRLQRRGCEQGRGDFGPPLAFSAEAADLGGEGPFNGWEETPLGAAN